MRLLTPITRTAVEVADDKADFYLERGFVRAEAASAKAEPKKAARKPKQKK